MATHKWVEEICAWAKGEAIQYNTRGKWEDFDGGNPNWESEKVQWRIKPAEPERVYPETKMSADNLVRVWYHAEGGTALLLTEVANAALRHACDASQIVTREEFDRAVGDRYKRDVAIAVAITEAWRRRVQESTGGAVTLGALDLNSVIAQVK